jgi:hypothetical protein
MDGFFQPPTPIDSRASALPRRNDSTVQLQRRVEQLEAEKREVQGRLDENAAKLKQKGQEFERMQNNIRLLREGTLHLDGFPVDHTFVESDSWKTSWEVLKKENDKLQAAAQTSLVPSGHRQTIVTMSPSARRAWYEGECFLFDCRVGLSSHPQGFCLKSETFLTMADIPWPIAPNTPAIASITPPMILSFLFPDLVNSAARTYIQSLVVRFEAEHIRHWMPCVLEKEREKVMQRSKQVVLALKSLEQ